MEAINQWRWSFRDRRASNASNKSNSSTDSNNNQKTSSAKRTGNMCDICGKRLLKLARWRNYFTLPCKLKHTFCKSCITDRLQCRQKVMGAALFDVMWTFPCPGSAQCGQELTVDWSRGQSYSKNLVARDLGSGQDSSLEEYDELEEGGRMVVMEEDESTEEEEGEYEEEKQHPRSSQELEVNMLLEIG